MNQQIKELAAECGMHFGDDDVTHNAYVSPPGRHEEGVPLAKFAQLIIRECEAYVAERFDSSEPWMRPGGLSQHFGVEE